MKTLVLVSGGLDSTVLLHDAVCTKGRENVIALSIFYGQKHEKELEYARWQCKSIPVQLFEADLSDVFKFNVNSSALLQGSEQEIKHMSYADQLRELGGSGTVSAYVPYRNGLFLSYAAAVALQLGCETILYGAHADDAAGYAYPDCTEDFISAQQMAIVHGTGYKVYLSAPFYRMTKADIVKHGLSRGMTHKEFEHTWSCYEGKSEPCGTCGTCLDRAAAFRANGIHDIL